MTKKKKIILSIVAVVLALASYGYFFGVQTVCAISVRMQMMRQTQLDVVPKTMTLEPCSAPVTALEAFDYRFSVPWSDCSQNTAITGVVWECSKSNFYIICFSPEEKGFYSAFLPDVSSETAEYRKMMIEMLGMENVINTNFYICKKIWETTPRDISLFDSQFDAIFKWDLLVFKGMALLRDGHEASFLEYGDIKGMQFGNPSVDSTIQLSIFDQMDREIFLTVMVSTNTPIRLTQADINTIITTFSSNP